MTPSPARLEYATAFDLAASWLSPVAPPILAVLSMPQFVDLALARTTAGLTIVCEQQTTATHAERRLGDGALPYRVALDTRVLADPREIVAGPLFGAVLWASPQAGSWPATLAALEPLLVPGALLCILTATTWGGLVRPLRVQSHAGEPFAIARRLRARLMTDGWTVRRRSPIGGLAGVGWAVANRLAARGGRTDLADRAEQAHHQSADGTVGASYELILASWSTQR